MSTEIKYEIKPFQDSPGTPTVKVFLRDLRNLGNKKGDDFGWTLTDNLDGVDAGGANGGPQLPGAANSAENRKALAAFAKRSKESSSLLYAHMLDPDVRVNYDAIRVGFPSVHAQAAAGVPHTGPFRSLGREQLQFFEAAYLPRILQVDLEIERNRQNCTLTVKQEKYVDTMGEKYKGKYTECELPTELSKAKRDTFNKMKPSDETTSTGEEFTKLKASFMCVMGEIRWLADWTRPDISYVASKLGCFMQSPEAEHLQAAYKVIGYLPADIFTKAVDLETHTKMRNLMMNISWVYKGNTAKMTRLVKALTDTLSRMA